MSQPHKKRRISKHVLNAKASQTEKTPQKRKRKAKKIKDSTEVLSYLTDWKEHRTSWKFNKNTQSWLLRHMYESDKVAKATFVLLLEYLQGIQGVGLERVQAEATRRALRYKHYEKQTEAVKDSEREEEAHDKAVVDPSSDADDVDEESRWKKLNDGDKRKEYKRARKILDALKALA